MKGILLFFALLATVTAVGQTEYQFGLLPSFNLNKKLSNDFALNFELESRQQLSQGLFSDSNAFDFEYILTDLTLIAGKKIAANQTVTLGYLFRIRDGQGIHRSIQQFIVTKKFTGLKLSQRFATDQTFEKNKSTAFRLRYRIATEIPLNGQSVDVGEFFLKLNNEYLNQLEASTYDLEVRLTPFLGYTISGNQKFELGLDYRISSFLEGPASHKFWIGMNWYQSL
ncbi:MAG: DUF2490 domain-containing protein [Bacteroidota bacterium]